MSDGCGCKNGCGCNHAEEVEYPEVTVYQSAEQIPSFSKASHKAESRFDKLQHEVAREYEKKDYSKKEAMKIGGAVAYDAGVKKYGKAGMERLAREGRRDKRDAESKFDKLSHEYGDLFGFVSGNTPCPKLNIYG